MFDKLTKNRTARQCLYAVAGVLLGYAVIRYAGYVICDFTEHGAEEETISGWAAIMFALAFGVVGAVLGSQAKQTNGIR